MLYDTVGPALLATLDPDEFQSTLELSGNMAFLEAALIDVHGVTVATATATARVITLDQARSVA
jgi:hypothetical protein